MICGNCNKEREKKDFVLDQPYCAKCMYEIKLKMFKKTMLTKKLCRMCNKEISLYLHVKQRQRSIYCSEECALKGHAEMRSNHWTRIICS